MTAKRKIFGLHAAEAAVQHSPEKLLNVWIDGQRQDKRLQNILGQLKAHGLMAEVIDRQKLNRMADGQKHQGIVVEMEMPEEKGEADLKDLFSVITGTPFFLVLDQVQDPHNLGACLRTADAVGLHGIIIPKDNAVSLTATVCQVASGAAETVPLFRVTNLARTLRWMKQQGVWIIGSAGEAVTTVFDADLTMPMALVIGAEATGMRRLTREICDQTVRLPMAGSVESLNLSVATGVMLYEIIRQRQK